MSHALNELGFTNLNEKPVSLETRNGSLEEILSLSKKQGVFNALIFTHRQADPDALCSGYAIAEAIKKSAEGSRSDRNATCKIIAPQGANLLGSSICTKLEIDFLNAVTDAEIKSADCIVAVDVGEPQLLAPYVSELLSSTTKKFLVDHHSSNSALQESQWTGFVTIVNPSATSTCEIITEQIPDGYLSTKVARALLAGLLFDSQHLGIATERTLLAALKLVRAGARIDETKDLLRSKPERSEIIARIKSAQRLKFEQAGKFFIIQSEVSSFQAAVARMLLEIGGDVGIAYGEHEGETRISLRSTQQFFRETKIDLGEFVSSLGSDNGLIGGGHSTAASISGKRDAGELAALIVKTLKGRLPN